MNGVYWQKGIAPFFTLEEMQKSDFNLKVIADITCDVNGSIPCNLGATSISNPTYGFDRKTFTACEPFKQGTVDVMAVDNLPNELPRDASDFFGVQLTKNVLPELFNKESEMLKRATIAMNGDLTSAYEYLRDYVN